MHLSAVRCPLSVNDLIFASLNIGLVARIIIKTWTKISGELEEDFGRKKAEKYAQNRTCPLSVNDRKWNSLKIFIND